jgi:dTDP-4-dehydrorhamnose 3,5-epimerase
MKILPTTLSEVILLELDVFSDHRGRFMETFRRDRHAVFGVAIGLEFVQDNFSSSQKGTLRGLHYQLHHPLGKLVHVPRGEVFDVAVDVRAESPTFGKSFGTILSADNHRQLWIPPGFAHGFLAISDTADIVYKMTGYYTPTDERTIAWNDPELAIAWPLIDGGPTLSKRDLAAPGLRAAELPRYAP